MRILGLRSSRTVVLVIALFASISCVLVGLAACGPITPPAATATPVGPRPGGHHPLAYADPGMHGPAAKFLREDCTQCHGAALDGLGSQIDPASLALAPQGCDSHHNRNMPAASTTAWRTDCTFCHGDRAGKFDTNKTGAPPRDLKDLGTTNIDAAMIGKLQFKKHLTHMTASATHVAYDCTTCHPSKPTDIMSPGHWIVGDSTPGIPDVAFSGVNAGGTFSANYTGNPPTSTCGNNYCHGTGKARGSVVDTQTSSGCSFCHGSLGGQHGSHLGGDIGAVCHDCHGTSVDTANPPHILVVAQHVNGTLETSFPTSTISFSGGRCTGSCHGQTHDQSW